MSPKVAAGAGAAGASSPLSIIVIWLIGLTHVTLPPEVAVAIGSLVAAGASLLAGYLVPHDPTTARLIAEDAAKNGQGNV
jgi:hypothetical protein